MRLIAFPSAVFSAAVRDPECHECGYERTNSSEYTAARREEIYDQLPVHCAHICRHYRATRLVKPRNRRGTCGLVGGVADLGQRHGGLVGHGSEHVSHGGIGLDE